MSNSVEDGIIVELDGDEIVVWKPGTVFLIAFEKPPHQRHPVVTRSWLADFTTEPLAEFRALAAQKQIRPPVARTPAQPAIVPMSYP